MADFYEHLLSAGRGEAAGRDREDYRTRLRSHIQLTLPPHPLMQKAGGVKRALLLDPAQDLSDSRFHEQEGILAIDLRSAGFRQQWIAAQEVRRIVAPLLRLDSLSDEIEVLETRAMGIGAYVVDVTALDRAQAQYLLELGRDYQLTGFLACGSEEDLARALTLHDSSYMYLQGKLAHPRLLELSILHGKTLLIDGRDEVVSWKLASLPPRTSFIIIERG